MLHLYNEEEARRKIMILCETNSFFIPNNSKTTALLTWADVGYFPCSRTAGGPRPRQYETRPQPYMTQHTSISKERRGENPTTALRRVLVESSSSRVIMTRFCTMSRQCALSWRALVVVVMAVYATRARTASNATTTTQPRPLSWAEDLWSLPADGTF
jgi:hypothetical protein